MPDLTLSLSERDVKDIRALACLSDPLPAAGLEDMAVELLRSHLVLIRDCGGILPARGPVKAGDRRRGAHGVSLGAGINGPLTRPETEETEAG